MMKRKVVVFGPDGSARQPGGVYIPSGKAKKHIEASAAKRNKAASPNAHHVGHASVRRDADEQVSLIGGMKATDISAETYVMSGSADHEMSEEERHKTWQPPQRDTSRFKGTSASRHRAGPSYRDPVDHPGGSFAADDELPPARKKDGKGSSRPKKKGSGRRHRH